ncbi:hypothetical protein M758_1G305000 [Ceratodon purpureus]|nr:hypothetical protein M758_1G305000 [Ceratodon purpureus]
MSGFVRKMSTVTAAKRLIPLLDRVLVEKIVPPTRSAGGILLPETTAKLNSGTVIEVGPGVKTKEGNLVPLDVKQGDTVLLPEYGGSHVKLEGKEYVLYRHDDLLGILEQ